MPNDVTLDCSSFIQGYYALDIYVEDYLKLNSELILEGIYFSYNNSMQPFDNNFINLTSAPGDPELSTYLKKFYRDVNYGNELNDSTWNLFLFKKTDKRPQIVELIFKSNSDKAQRVRLQ